MRINKGIQSMAKNITAQKHIRPILAGIQFDKNIAVCTDSFKLMEVEFDKYEDKYINDNLPNLKNFTKRVDESIMISSEDILEIKIPKTKLDIANIAQIGNVDTEKNEVSLGIYDLKKEIVINTKGIESNFPDYPSFFKNDNVVETGVNIEHLMDLLKTYKDFGVKNLKMKVGTPLQPIIFTCEGDNEIKSQGIKEIKTILMPVKI